KHYLLQRDPLWCGLLLYNFRMVAYECSTILASRGVSILPVAHLYKRLRQSQHLPTQWPDMDHVISAQGANHLFVGGLPSSSDGCAKRLALALGM
ncbi:uncharacterized protein MYCGRDRAFT_29504, partial [Zymoseptoria tritici IPO323]